MITSELRSERGRTLVIKRADPAMAVDAARLAREATLLEMARHPGVVQLADPAEATGTTEAGAALELRTIVAGARTLAAPDLDPLTVARAVATAAGTVADLHALGLVHGRLDPDHIVLTGSGRAVLCGFAEAGLAGDLRPDGQVLVPSVDVASLGSLLQRALADAGGAPDGRRSGLDRSAAARLADRATAAEPALRPSARAFAAGLAACLPPPPAVRPRPRSLSGPTPPADPPSGRRPAPDAQPAPPPVPQAPGEPPHLGHRVPRRRGRRLLAFAGAAIAVISLGVGVDALADLPPGAARPSSPDQPSPVDPPVPGGELDIDGHRLALGTPDDQVVEAVWGCTGPSAVVLIRPDGSVFRFDGLATPDHDVAGELVGRVPAGAVVQVVTGVDGCLALQARAADRTEVLTVPAAPPSPTPA